MEPTMNIDNFSPKKAELETIVAPYRSLEIKGVDDTAGYSAVDTARKDLKSKRVEIQKTGKVLRADALAFQKAVIKAEADLIAIIEPTENELQEKLDAIDREKTMVERRKRLPEKVAKLAEIGCVATDDELLAMDDAHYFAFFNSKKQEWLEKKERAIADERMRIEKEKERMEIEKEIAENKAREAELVEVNRKHDEEVARIKKTQDDEDRKKREKDAEAKRVADAENEKKEVEMGIKHREFLKANGWDGTDNFIIGGDMNHVILYKKVAEYIREMV